MSSAPLKSDAFNATERRAALSLAGVYAVRMLGLFMLLPVLALYAHELKGSTPLLVGLAVGVYGLTQAVLQMPFGVLSDRFGRKPVIYVGLVLFAIGSVWAALADSALSLVLARALQGAGAIAAVIMALAADLSRESQRTKIMAVIGASIGASFLLALMLGPLLSAYIGVNGLFWLALVFAVIGFLLVAQVVPSAEQRTDDRKIRWVDIKTVFTNRQLLILDISILLLHAVLTALFVLIPFLLVEHWALSKEQHWWVYLPVMAVSLLCVAPIIMRISRSGSIAAWVHWVALGVCICAAALLYFSAVKVVFITALLLFFILFSVLESALPAQVSKLVSANANIKGAALGVYSSAQFFGAFLGSVIAGGSLIQASADVAVCVLVAVGVVWCLLARFATIP